MSEELKIRKIQRYGWIPQVPDIRDFLFTAMAPSYPAEHDLRPQDNPVFDQGQLGSCTGNSIAGAYAFDEKKQEEKVFTPSRLFIYYNERVMEGTVSQDAGAQIRDGIKSIANVGVCDEAIWPYDISKFAAKPGLNCYTQAKTRTAVSYHAVPQTEASIKATLAGGFPIVFGFTVYNSFESQEVASTGKMPMPNSNDAVVGGHAVLAVGYTTDTVIVRNSWGPDWGDKGYFYMPLAYILNPNLASDFWVVQKVK